MKTGSQEYTRDSDALLPPKPEEPLSSDCCGSGCSPCVFDIYRLQLEEWERQCSKIRNNEGLVSETLDVDSNEPLLSEIKFCPFQILSIQPHTHDTFMYLFQAVKINLEQDGVVYVHVRKPLNVKLGQHLVMKFNCDESVLTRAYTPILDSKASRVGRFEVLIKLYGNGRMSKCIKTLERNDIVEWRGPYGSFQYTPNTYRHILMFCAGTGIAPMYPIARSIVEDDLDETFVRLLFSCKYSDDILLRDEMRHLSQYWNFSSEIFLTQVDSVSDQAHYGETVRKGRISNNVIKKELEGKMLAKVLVLVCGTKSFSKDMINFVKQVGLLESNIHLF